MKNGLIGCVATLSFCDPVTLQLCHSTRKRLPIVHSQKMSAQLSLPTGITLFQEEN